MQDKVITIFTDYACPFCYIAYRQCRRIEAVTGCTFEEIFKEIHPDLPYDSQTGSTDPG